MESSKTKEQYEEELKTLEAGQIVAQKKYVELKKAKADKSQIDDVMARLKEGKEKIATLHKEFKELYPEDTLGKVKAKPKEKKVVVQKEKFEADVMVYTLPEELLPGVGVETTNPILPIEGRRNILITSSLPYVNNVPHLGNIIGCVLSADVYARYARLRGHNVLYVCGTDEYGTATETKAAQEGLTPLEVCNKYYKVHKQIYEWFGIQFDKFGRTTCPQQTPIAQQIFLDIHKNDYLVAKSLEQLYCLSCAKFLADRFVEGTCPKEGCGSTDARGDQCDQCQGLLNPIELINPRCKTCGSTPEPRFSEHLFLDLPRFEGRLSEWVDESVSRGNWSQNSITTTKDKWLKEGLQPRCLTRDLKWGTPVPLDNYRDKVFYVWFDAPIGYISITAAYTEEWEKWWKNPKNVELFMFMGKDNVPFHCIIFPASLMATGGDWTMLHSISTTEYLNYEGTQFSKSRGVGVFGDSAMQSGIAAEVWRYYLLANRPETADSDFSWEDFGAKNNNELLANLGNFVNRCLKFVKDRFDSLVPAAQAGVARHEDDEALIAEVQEQLELYIREMDLAKMKASLHVAMHISRLGNNYLQKQEPWKLIKSDPVRCATVISLGTNLVAFLTTLLEPFLPHFTEKVLRQMQLDHRPIPDRWDPVNTVPAGHRIATAMPIFREIKKHELVEFARCFGGKQEEQPKPKA